MKSSNPTPRLRLRVTATAAKIVHGGHPWVFADSVREQNREGNTGELAIIFDRNDRFLAVGLYDADSPIRVRILHKGKPLNIDQAFWKNRLDTTLAKRAGLFDVQTNGYRCINGESDGWPGLILDRYAETLVLKLYTAAWFPLLNEITELIAADFRGFRIVLRLSRNIQKHAAEKFNLRDGTVIRGEPVSDAIVFLESGIRFEADVLRGQKTGFFLDQRENRRLVESLAGGRRILNAFSFSGGFSLYAARGKAASVTSLDISAHALESAKRNFSLNTSDPNVSRCQHETVQSDVFEWLQKPAREKFDLIILDPPSLAKREAERAEAIRAYTRLSASAIERLSPGGILVSASCSAHVSSDEFFNAVRQAARSSDRRFRELRTTHHAPDHETTFKEAEYLKCIYLAFSN